MPDFTILGVQPSKRAEDDAQYHHLLDNAMYDPRKKVTKKKHILLEVKKI